MLERETLFERGPEYLIDRNNHFYDVSPVDQRFLMVRRPGLMLGGEDSRPRFVVVQNFFEELKDVVPDCSGRGANKGVRSFRRE